MRSIKAWLTGGTALFIFLALVVAGLFVTRGLDLTAYRPQIIARLDAATGRAFAIGEGLELGFRRGLVIRAHDVQMGNADWGSEPMMLRVQQAELRLGLYPLLRGELHIEHIDLEGPDLLLETDGSGRGNWEFDCGGDEGNTGIDVASISIESGSLEWRADPSSAGRPVKVSDISLTAKDDGLSLTVTADARILGKPVRLAGQVASQTSWRHGQPLDLHFHLGSEAGDVQVKGTVERTTQGVIPSLSISATELDVAMLAELAGRDAPRVPAVDVTLVLTRHAETWNIDLENVTVGNSDLAGSVQVEDTVDEPRISGSLTANRIEFGELLPGFEEAPGVGASDRRLFSSSPIDLSFLNKLWADLELRAATLGIPNQKLRSARIEARLEDNRLKLSVHGSSPEGNGTLRGTLLIDGDGELPSWSMDLALSRYPASVLQRAAAVTAIDAPVDLTIDVEARGESLRQMAKSLSGKARIIAGQGRARLRTVDNFVGGLSTVAGQLFEAGRNDTQLNCVVGDLRANQGVVTTQVALIDSAAATLRVDGTVDLGREKIDLTVTPRPKKPTLTVAVPVHVRGALQNPDFEPDRTSSLAKLIGVGSLLVYPPAAVIALGDLGDSGNSCAQMINSPSVREKKKRSPVRRVAEGIGDAASAIGLGIKRLFGN